MKRLKTLSVLVVVVCAGIGAPAAGQIGKDVSLADAAASFIGENSGDSSGYSVASAGDVNGDGFDDFIVGAAGDDVGPFLGAGRAYIVYGGDFSNVVTDHAAPGGEFIQGTAGADILIGNRSNDTAAGGGGQDVLRGGAGEVREDLRVALVDHAGEAHRLLAERSGDDGAEKAAGGHVYRPFHVLVRGPAAVAGDLTGHDERCVHVVHVEHARLRGGQVVDGVRGEYPRLLVQLFRHRLEHFHAADDDRAAHGIYLAVGERPETELRTDSGGVTHGNADGRQFCSGH